MFLTYRAYIGKPVTLPGFETREKVKEVGHLFCALIRVRVLKLLDQKKLMNSENNL